MFGFRLIHASELEKREKEYDLGLRAYEKEIALLNKHISMLDNELAYYRNRAEDERQRADRLNDALMQQNGLPEVTSTVKRERADDRDRAKEEFERRQQQIGEIYAEEMNTNYDDEGLELLPPDLAEAAQALMGEVKKTAKKD